MKELSIKELYGLKTAVHALSFYNVKGIDVQHLDNLLFESIRDTYGEQLQREVDKNQGFTEVMLVLTNEFESERNLHQKHIEELNWERDWEQEQMLMSEE